jgi:hypothetical protein
LPAYDCRFDATTALLVKIIKKIQDERCSHENTIVELLDEVDNPSCRGRTELAKVLKMMLARSNARD